MAAMTETVRWFDAYDRGEESVLVPVGFLHSDDLSRWEEEESLRRIRGLVSTMARPWYLEEPPMGTVTPDRGETLILRLPAHDWLGWTWDGRFPAPGMTAALETRDLFSGAPWRIVARAHDEFQALWPERREFHYPPWEEHRYVDALPLIYDRYPQLRPAHLHPLTYEPLPRSLP